jgi:tRNA(fMet)-specific endonuclease VapC
MSLFLLDSDTLSLLQAGHESIAARTSICAPGQIAITVITVDEQLRGWYSLVRRAKKSRQIAFAYDRLAKSVSYLSRTQIVTFTETAIDRYEGLRKAKLGVGGNDLRIAAIALENQATVVTRNVRDFQLVPGLKVEDWSKP